MKRCSKCKEVKDKSLFYRDKKRKDGLSCYCKQCAIDANSPLSKMKVAIKKIDYIEFQKIYGVNTCKCKICGKIKERATHTSGEKTWYCADCYSLKRKQNLETRKQRPSKAKSIYKGVSFDRVRQKYRASISVNKISKYLGTFKTEVEAAKAYNQYVIDNNLNRPLNIIESDSQ